MAIAYSANTAIVMDISSLAPSTTLLGGVESTQIDASAGTYNDYLITVKPITAGATVPVVNQYIGLWMWGSDTSLATTPIDVLDGTSSAETLSHASILNSLKRVATPTVTVATASLTYYIPPFTAAKFFGGVPPKFFGFFLAHNHAGALAAGQASLFSFSGVTFS